MQTEFSQAAIEALNHYVYCLVDPRNNKNTIFYVGEGCGNRVFDHARCAIVGSAPSDKLDMIREILNSGHSVKYYILRHNLTEQEAYTVESTIIDLLTYPEFNNLSLLTNIVAGHHQWDEGIKKSYEIEQMYSCAPIEPKHKLLLVSLNKTYLQKNVRGVYVRKNIYEATRGYWTVNKSRADNAEYILGVYKGIVRLVIKPTSEWKLATHDDNGNQFIGKRKRYCIDGVTDDITGNNLYMNKDVSAYPFGRQGSFTYINM